MPQQLDQELTKWIKTARSGKPMMFAYIAKAQGGKLLVGKKILPKAIADAKKEVGSNSVFRGRCVGEQGTLYFEVAKEVPQALPLQIKRAIKQDTGLIVDCLIRMKDDAEAEVEGEDVGEAAAEAADAPKIPPAPPLPGAKPAAPAADGKAVVIKRINAISDNIKTALTAKGPNVSRIQTLFGAINGLMKNNDFEQAGKVLDELEPLVKAEPAPAAPTPAPPPPGSPGAAVMKRLNSLKPGLTAAIVAKGPDVSRIQSLFVAVSGLIKNQDFDQAGQVLDELEPLVSKSGAAQTPPAAPPSPAALQAAVMKRFNALAPDLKAAIAAKGPDVARIQTLFVATNGLIKNNDFAQAAKTLDELEPLLARATTAAAAPAEADVEDLEEAEEDEAAAELFASVGATAGNETDEIDDTDEDAAPIGAVDYAKVRQDWERDRKTAHGELDRLQAAILAECKGEDQYAEIAKAVERLDGVLLDLDERLAKLFEAAQKTEGDKQRAHHLDARKLIVSYRAYVSSNKIMKRIDNNPFLPVTVQGLLLDRLTELDSQLRG